MEIVDMIKTALGGSKPADCTGKSERMNPKFDSSRSWSLPSGRDLLGKFITSAQSGFTQTKNNFVQTGRQCTPFLRLNSQGESTTSEEELSSFPTISPPTKADDKMYRPTCQGTNVNTQWGFCQPKGYCPSNPQPSIMGIYPGQNGCCPQWPVKPTMGYQPYSVGNGQWIPPYNFYPGMNTLCQNYAGDVFQFQGNCHSGYRNVPFPPNRHYGNSKPRGRSPNSGQNWNRCSKQQKRRKSKERPVVSKPSQDNNRSSTDHSADLINKMSSISISSPECSGTKICDCSMASAKPNSGHSDVRLDHKQQSASVTSAHENKLEDIQASRTLTSNKRTPDISKQQHPSSPIRSLGSIGESSERIDDQYLAIELCSPTVPTKSDVQKGERTDNCNQSQRATSSPSTRQIGSGQPLEATCILLTPKAPCDNVQRKKKSRPSAKKRRRQQKKDDAKERLFQLSRHNINKKTKTEQGDNDSNSPRPRCDSMSFVIDFSESDISEAENLVGSSPKCSSSSPLAKFSLFISGADLSSDSDDDSSDSDSNSETSDSDFFDEDQTDNLNHKTPSKTALADRVTPHFAMDVFPEFEQFSPFTVQIRCNFSSPASVSASPSYHSNRKTQGSDDTSHKNDCKDMEISSDVTEANKKWEDLYGQEPVIRNDDNVKVCFPDDSILTSVHTLKPEEVEIYEQARKGPWEEFARDRERFNKRIQDVADSISYCLDSKHRAKVLQRLGR